MASSPPPFNKPRSVGSFRSSVIVRVLLANNKSVVDAGRNGLRSFVIVVEEKVGQEVGLGRCGFGGFDSI